MAQAAVRSGQPGRALPPWVTTFVDAPVTRWAVGIAGLLLRGLGGAGGVSRPAERREPVARSLLRAAVGRPGGGVTGRRAGVAGTVTGAHGAPVASAAAAAERLSEAWGYWPAALGLFAFVWLELASPDPGSLAAVKVWLVLYFAVTLAGTLVCGERWCSRADPFEVYSVVASRLSPLRRNPDALIAIGNPFDHLRRCRCGRAPSRCWPCCWDPQRSTVFRRCRSGATSSSAHRVRRPATLVRTCGSAGVRRGSRRHVLARPVDTGGVDAQRRRELPGLMAHSLIPIVIG